MIKSKITGKVQEIVLPDFPDDETTVTKSRRVSFGTNFIKEFIVGSAVSAKCMSEYEQAFPSSDSSNADSSHSIVESGIPDHSTFVVPENLKVHKSFSTVIQPTEPDSVENPPKPPKFSSTICFSADSPTADMEFTEGCITLAKSILDKKNKEMTVIIQSKSKESKIEEKPKEEETKYFDASEFEMSMTRCLKSKENKREEKRFDNEKTKIFSKFEDEMSITRCHRVFNNYESDSSLEDCKENQLPLDVIMRHLDQDNSDLESDLFNPEKSFANLLVGNPFDFSDDSEKLDLNESMDISSDFQPQNKTSDVRPDGKKLNDTNFPEKVAANESVDDMEISIAQGNHYEGPENFVSEQKNTESNDLENFNASDAMEVSIDVLPSIFEQRENLIPNVRTSELIEKYNEPMEESNNVPQKIHEIPGSHISDEDTAEFYDLRKVSATESIEESKKVSPNNIEISENSVSNTKNDEHNYFENFNATKPKNDCSNIPTDVLKVAENSVSHAKNDERNYFENFNATELKEDSANIPTDVLKVPENSVSDAKNDEHNYFENFNATKPKNDCSNIPTDVLKVAENSVSHAKNDERNYFENFNATELKEDSANIPTDVLKVPENSVSDAKNDEHSYFENFNATELKEDSANIPLNVLEVPGNPVFEKKTPECSLKKLNATKSKDQCADLSPGKMKVLENSVSNGKTVEPAGLEKFNTESTEESARALPNEVLENMICNAETAELNDLRKINEPINGSEDVTQIIPEVLENLIHKEKTAELNNFENFIAANAVEDSMGVPQEVLEVSENPSPSEIRTDIPDKPILNEPVEISKDVQPDSLEIQQNIQSEDQMKKSIEPNTSDECEQSLAYIREPSLVDQKVIESLKEQSKEPGCLWSLKDYRHPQGKTPGLLSFNCELLESAAAIDFDLKNSNEDTLDSCSIVRDSVVGLKEEKKCRLPEYELVIEFGFLELKKYFVERRQKVETIRHIPYFLDQINSFMFRINSYLRQIYSILTLYPGSRLRGPLLSFRLYSFPLFFSCIVLIDLSDLFRLSKTSLSFDNDFGSLDENKIREIFQECLKMENSLCEFIIQSTKYLFDLEKQSGYVSKRQHIRLLPLDLKM